MVNPIAGGPRRGRVYRTSHRGDEWSDAEDMELRRLIEQCKLSFGDCVPHMQSAFPEARTYTRNGVLGRAKRCGIVSAYPARKGVTGRKRKPRPEKMIKVKRHAIVKGRATRNTSGLREDGEDRGGRYKPLMDHERKPWKRISKEERAARKAGSLPNIIEDAPKTSKLMSECGERDCKWPTSPDVLCMEVCGQPATFGAYCDHHGQMAYRTAPTIKRNGSFFKKDQEYKMRLDRPSGMIEEDEEIALLPAGPSPSLLLEYQPEDREDV